MAGALRDVCRELASDPDSPRAAPARAVLDALTAPDGQAVDPDRVSRAFAALAGEKKGRKAAGSEALKALLERTRGSNNSERARALVRLIIEGPTLDARLQGVSLVIAEIQTRLRERHVAQHSLGFGDLLRLTRDGLRDKPEVARAAAARIELLLVDEFQDTSRVQCELLLLLRERPEQNRQRAPGTLPTSPREAWSSWAIASSRFTASAAPTCRCSRSCRPRSPAAQPRVCSTCRSARPLPTTRPSSPTSRRW
jgi:ATP-dependent helicase/nuclease subunit A